MPEQQQETAAPGVSPLQRIFAGGDRFPAWHSLLAIFLLLLCVQQPLRVSHHTFADGRDLRTVIAGAACLREGCSPYDTDALNRMFAERGAQPRTQANWAVQLPIYPPQTMALLTPLSFGSMRSGLLMNWAINWVALLFGVGVVVFRSKTMESVSPLLRSALVGVMFLRRCMEFTLESGNPVVLVTALLLFAVADLPERYGWLRAAALGLACLLKPQLALPFALVLLVRSHRERRRLAVMVAALVAFSAAVWAWCAAHPALRTWLPDLRRELAQGSAAGSTMNPAMRTTVFDSLLNLDYLLGYWIPSHARVMLTASILFVLLGLIVLAAWRIWRSGHGEGSWETALLTAAVCTWTLLPVYHRFYDSLLIILVTPWIALALGTRRTWAPAVVALVFCEGIQAQPGLIWRRWKLFEGIEVPRSAPDFLLRRYGSLCTVLLCALLVTMLLRTGFRHDTQRS